MEVPISFFEEEGLDDWMVGGSQDVEGERLFGVKPSHVAAFAAQAYAEARSRLGETCSREAFFTEVMCGFGAVLSWAMKVDVRDVVEH